MTGEIWTVVESAGLNWKALFAMAVADLPPVAEPAAEVVVLLLGQSSARDNGPWLVSQDSSHRRP